MSALESEDPWGEWKTGYRDGLGAAIAVAETCAADPTATAADVQALLKVLSESSVIQPDNGGYGTHVEPPDTSAFL